MRFAFLPVTLSLLAATPVLAGSADLKIVDAIKGTDGGWDYASIDSAHHRLLVARGDGLMAVDLANNEVTPTLVHGQRMHGAVIAPSDIGVVANGGTGSALVFNGADGKILAEIATGKKPDAVVYDPKTGLAAVMDNAGGGISLIDPKTKASAGKIDVEGDLEFAVADGAGRIFVNVENKNDLAVIDVAGRKVSARHPLTGCEEPSGLALDPKTHVLLSACRNGKAVATSSEDGKVIATLPIGSGPDAVIFDERNARFLVPCGGSGVLTVISEKNGALSVTDTIQTAHGARLGALDPASGKVYLPAADYQPAAKQGERPTQLPGTFRILVLAAP